MWRFGGFWYVALLVGVVADGRSADNFVPNASFERIDLRAEHLPAGWEIEKGPRSSFRLSSDRPFDGRHCLELTATVEPATLAATNVVSVEPGATYRLRYHFRIDKSNLPGGQAVYLQGRYLDADGRLLDWRKHGAVTLNTGGRTRPSFAWLLREIDFTVPEPARSLELRIRPGRGWQGILAVDGLSLKRVVKAQFKPPDGTRAFQFIAGADSEPVDGFIAVGPTRSFDRAGDFGWRLRAGQALSRVPFASQPGYPTRLQEHAVRRATFSCALPDGRYVASIYMGALWRTSIETMNHVGEAGHNRVVNDVRDRDRLMDEEYFRYVHATLVTRDDIERGGLAVYDRYIRPRYRRHDFEVDVTGGRLDLAIRQGFASAVVVTPAAAKSMHHRTIETLDQSLAEEFASTWAEQLPSEWLRGAIRGDYQPTDEDRRRGYVVFRRHWMEAVEHGSRPESADIVSDLTLQATPGEYEPTTFSFWPQKDLSAVRVTVGDLKSDNGSILPGETVRVWYLQQKHERRPLPATAYRIRGTFLPDWETRDLFRDVTQRCWLSARVPDNAKAGVYRGSVRIEANGAPATTLSLTVRVLPFVLERPERIHVMRRGANQVLVPYPVRYPVEGNDVRNKQFYRKMALDDLFAHGFAPEFALWWVGIYDRDTGKIAWNQTNSLSGPPEQFLQLIKDSPFGRKDWLWADAASMNNRGLLDAFGSGSDTWEVEDTGRWLDALSTKLADSGFTRVYLHASAEESHLPKKAGVEGWRNFLRYVRDNRKRWPNIFTTHTCYTDWGHPIALADCDLVGLGVFHGPREGAAAQVEAARATGRPFLLYGTRGRMVPGYYLWKAGASGTFHEFYAPYFGTLNNDWDNDLGMDSNARQVLNEAPGWCNAVYSPTGRMIGSWFWEELREGVDDDAYLTTLENWIARAKLRRELEVVAARKKAEHALAEIADRIDLNVERALGGRGLSLYLPFAPAEFDELRSKAIAAIIELKAAMKEDE